MALGNGDMQNKLKAKLDEREVIKTESLLVTAGENIQIFPFDDDPLFRLNIRLIFDETRQQAVHYINKEEIAEIRIVRNKFVNDETFVDRRGVNFADDANYEYWLKTACHILGNPDRYSFILYYNVIREAKQP